MPVEGRQGLRALTISLQLGGGGNWVVGLQRGQGRPHHNREIGEALGAPKARKLLGDTVPLSKVPTECLLFTLGGFCIAYSSILVVYSVFVYFPLFFDLLSLELTKVVSSPVTWILSLTDLM